MKLLKSVFLLSFFTVFAVSVNAQTTENNSSYQNSDETTTENDQYGIPESYQQEQNQLDEEYTSGNSTYNIDENEGETAYEESSWRSESDEEELRVYSGFQDGNNVVKKIHVRVPESMQDSGGW